MHDDDRPLQVARQVESAEFLLDIGRTFGRIPLLQFVIGQWTAARIERFIEAGHRIAKIAQ